MASGSLSSVSRRANMSKLVIPVYGRSKLARLLFRAVHVTPKFVEV
jgi:hypothetical protein